MTTFNLETKLRKVDFSGKSKVKESLLDRLLERHRQDNAPQTWWKADSMSVDDLDMVNAAGNNPYGYEPQNK